ncbi:hypothetical protein ASPCAL00263 [Aspergillus calidoustus]|uniref:DUF4470 domain-containing protein n=1 Tax=Aspergillus calidoustus TaxID=454130 RepID=A0A0U5C185_ASPCI|nr:hypothetical protein ASPCAL00263 [Aspergillus calidoustus]
MAQKYGSRRCTKVGFKTCRDCHLVLVCYRSAFPFALDLSLTTLGSTVAKYVKSPIGQYIKSWRPSWDTEDRVPTFIDNQILEGPFVLHDFGGTKTFWGRVPAIDLLQLKDNEGRAISQDLVLLLAGCGDLRSLIKTINALPEAYTGCLDVDLNDKEEMVVARNVILLLVALNFPPNEASVLMLHLWYSAFLPKDLLQSVQTKIVPLLQGLLTLEREEPTSISRRTFSFHGVTLTAFLPGSFWEKILSDFARCFSTPFSEAAALRQSVTMAAHRQDYVDRALFRLPPPWRLAHMRFREDGLLLPFGASRDEFNIPNPLFFQTTESWPMPDSADPLDGWKLAEILQSSYGATNDIHGQLYLHVLGFLREFCEKLPGLKLTISLLNMDAFDLPTNLGMFYGKERAYDRIDLASVAKTGPQLAEALDSFGPLLQSKTQNPRATVLTMFPDIALRMRTFADQKNWLSRKTVTVQQFLSLDSADLSHGCYKADYLNFLSAHDLFLNRNAIFNRFIQSARLAQIATSVGLEMKPKHTVIAKWPLRLPKSPTKHDFEMLHWSSHHGSERYIEWQRAR